MTYVHDGIVIGGPAHGEHRDTEKCGPVLVVPVIRHLPIRFDQILPDVPDVLSDSRAVYRLHEFHFSDGKSDYGRTSHRVWMPDHVQPHQAFGFLIETALRAKGDA